MLHVPKLRETIAAFGPTAWRTIADAEPSVHFTLDSYREVEDRGHILALWATLVHQLRGQHNDDYTAWAESINAAVESGDALALLVFADFAAEQSQTEWERIARLIASYERHPAA